MEQLALECWLGRPDAAGIAAWSAELDPSDPASELRRLSSADRVEAFREEARSRCGYPPRTVQGSAAAIIVLRNLCQAALDGEIRLIQLGDAVARVESVYVLDNTDPDVAAPPCIDDLRNLLDWCDDSWTLENNRDLQAELRRIHDVLLHAAG